MSDCQPSVIRTETPSFWRLRSLSFEGRLERKKCSIFLVIKCKQRLFGSISTFCFSAGAGAQQCSGNWSKTDPQPMGPYRYLWAAVFTFNPYLLISINEIIDINNSFIDINKYGHIIHLY